jgi:hypothetical protein
MKSVYHVLNKEIINFPSGRMRLVGHVAKRGEAINGHGVLIVKFKGQRPFGREYINGRIIWQTSGNMVQLHSIPERRFLTTLSLTP